MTGTPIARFIGREILLPRLQRNGVLVVYDPERRYRELCLELASESLRVVDASESSITSREAAQQSLLELGRPNPAIAGLLVYVPARAPVADEDRQRDPFALYTACGSVFPDGDGDEYPSLCLKARPDHATAIRRIFADNPAPDFAVIDAVGEGPGWPNLRALLGAESAQDILCTLLVPDERRRQALKDQDSWVGEARSLFKATLGLSLKTRSRAWSMIAEELWRFLLFSEFAFDLPQPLPPALANVPHAPEAARPLAEALCERLRNDRRTRTDYIERAETIERELDLPARCADIGDFGQRATFPFEERRLFARALDALQQDDAERVRISIRHHAGSVWVGQGESQVRWGVLDAALKLIETCADLEHQLPEHNRSQDSLLDFYLNSLQEADRLQREFEQAAGDHLDSDDDLQPLVERAHGRYRRLTEQVQQVFVRHLENSGWPPAGRLANADVFDRLVAPCLQQNGRRVAYFQIDALRYELGVALRQQLQEDEVVELQAAFAQLPSITQVGMVSLLPGAGSRLQLVRKDDSPVVQLGDTVVATVSQRMEVLRKQYGDRFAELKLNDFVRSKKALPDTVHLLVLRSVDIDSHLENNPETTLGLIHDTLKRIRVALHKLRKAGFHEVVIATDHGFFLNAQAEAGDVCGKPPGRWVKVHERCLLGDGTADSHNFVVSTEKLGIRGDFAQFAGPRSMAPYRSGMLYFHGGASLQETVVPVLTAKLGGADQPAVGKASAVLRYKNDAKRITTRLPVFDLILESGDLFSRDADFEVLLEAHDPKGNMVGEARPGGVVDPATGTISLKLGQQVQVALRMQLDFEGYFTVKVLDPTTLTQYCSLELETDYAV